MYIVGLQATRLLDTYAPFFRKREDALEFLKLCVGKYMYDPDAGPGPYVHDLADTLVQQPHTILSLADSITDSDYLRLTLVMTLVESTSKIWFNYHQAGNSKKYCMKFFQELCPEQCLSLLLKIVNTPDLSSAIDFLYNVRCKAVHEGKLHTWHTFSRHEGWKSDNSLYVYNALRHVVLSGCIETIRKSFDKECHKPECPGHNKSWELICGPTGCAFSTTRRVRRKRA